MPMLAVRTENKGQASNVESTLDAAFALIEEAHQAVRRGMHDNFFHADGRLKLSEAEIFEWVADRAVDEFKIGHQAATLITRFGHVLEPWLLNALGRQVHEEMRHYRLLYSILPEGLQARLRGRMESLPQLLGKNVRWRSLVHDVQSDDYVGALLEVTLVHEGFAAAAITPALSLPIRRVAKAYRVIHRDEQTHYAIGRKFVQRHCRTPDLAERVLDTAREARIRADGCCQYGW